MFFFFYITAFTEPSASAAYKIGLCFEFQTIRPHCSLLFTLVLKLCCHLQLSQCINWWCSQSIFHAKAASCNHGPASLLRSKVNMAKRGADLNKLLNTALFTKHLKNDKNPNNQRQITVFHRKPLGFREPSRNHQNTRPRIFPIRE